MKTIIFDTETTGLLKPSGSPLEDQPRIIELGIVVVQDMVITAERSWLIYPECQISEQITKINGITNSDLKGKPLFRQLLAEIEDVFAGSDFGVAHNSPFDTGMLRNELLRCSRSGFPWPRNMLCSAQEFTPFMGFRPKLTQLYEKVMGFPLAQTHRALDDAIALYSVLEKTGVLLDLELELNLSGSLQSGQGG
mgnify:CR=1 FL=1